MTNPGYQYQPRKPSEKNKRAKLAAKAKPAPLLTFNEDKSVMSCIPGQGASGKLATELEAFNNSKWPAGPPAIFGQLPLPELASTSFVTNPVNMSDILYRPGPTTTKNYFASVEQTAFSDQTSKNNYQADIALPVLDDLEVFFNSTGNINDTQTFFIPEGGLFDTEVLRQAALNEEFKDGLNDFFDFDSYE
jgi:hypothetical protein